MPDLSTFDAIFLDLDGTIWHENVPLEGSIELIQGLQRSTQKHAFVSNSSMSPAMVSRRFAGFGLEVGPDVIHTAAAAACDYIAENWHERARVFNVANEMVPGMLNGRGTFVENDGDPCDVVLVATLANDLVSIPRLQTALRFLQRGAGLVGMCDDRAYPTPRGTEIGSGAVTRMLAYAANVKPVFCGKPEAWFFLDLCKRLAVEPWRCVLIGDNLEADIAGARGVGMKSILTLTGLATRENAESAVPEQRADWVVGSLKELLFQ